MVCCLKLLSATFGNAEVFHAPMGWWKASTMFFGADAFKQPIGAWNMSAVTNMGGCSMELLPPPNRLVPGTHQQWLVRWWNSILHALYTMFENKVTWHMSSILHIFILHDLLLQYSGAKYSSRNSSRYGLLSEVAFSNLWQCWSVPCPNGLVEGKHHVLWCWCLQAAHWGLEHVSSDQHGGMFHGATATTQQIGAWNASAVTGSVVEQYTACFVYNVWKQSYLAYVLHSTYIYFTWFIIAVFRRKVQLSQQPFAMLKCSMPQWAGGRLAPCSLVLMPSTSPLGPGTLQQRPPSNRCFCWSSLELKSLNDLTTWGLRH